MSAVAIGFFEVRCSACDRPLVFDQATQLWNDPEHGDGFCVVRSGLHDPAEVSS
jgi:hypothetical protein